MRETMIAADGVGLAGPQVGMMRRLFVVWDTTDAPEEIPEDYAVSYTHLDVYKRQGRGRADLRNVPAGRTQVLR